MPPLSSSPSAWPDPYRWHVDPAGAGQIHTRRRARFSRISLFFQWPSHPSVTTFVAEPVIVESSNHHHVCCQANQRQIHHVGPTNRVGDGQLRSNSACWSRFAYWFVCCIVISGRSQSPGEQLQDHHHNAWSQPAAARLPLPNLALSESDRLLMQQSQQGWIKGGEQDHEEAVHLGQDHIIQEKGSSEARHEHADTAIRRPSSNTSSSDDTIASSGWLALPQQCCGNGDGCTADDRRRHQYDQAVSAMVVSSMKPPSLEMSLGRQGWQMEQCSGAESSASASQELTLLKCL